ncbi:hypothetical protein MTO96_031120, partial [Rhipicephalus appendiculatus]
MDTAQTEAPLPTEEEYLQDIIRVWRGKKNSAVASTDAGAIAAKQHAASSSEHAQGKNASRVASKRVKQFQWRPRNTPRIEKDNIIVLLKPRETLDLKATFGPGPAGAAVRSIIGADASAKTRPCGNTRLRRGDSVDKTLQFGNTERTNIVPVMRMPRCGSTRLRRGDSVDKTLQFGNTKRTHIVLAMRMPQCESTRLRRGDSVDKTLQFGKTKRTHIVPVLRMPQCESTRLRRGDSVDPAVREHEAEEHRARHEDAVVREYEAE